MIFCAVIGLALSFNGCVKDRACRILGHTYAALPIDSTRTPWTFTFDPEGGVVEVGDFYGTDTIRTDLHWLIINDLDVYIYPNDHIYQHAEDIIAAFCYDPDHDKLRLRYYKGLGHFDTGSPRFYRVE